MDLLNNRTRNIAEMALDGLYERSKAISSNTVNALTPGYQRKEVSFEDSLRNVIQKENERENIKLQNTQYYQKNPQEALLGQSPAQIAFLNSEMRNDFSIHTETDYRPTEGVDGNNVNIEEEMMAEAKNGMQYQIIASLLSKSYASMKQIISGQNSNNG